MDQRERDRGQLLNRAPVLAACRGDPTDRSTLQARLDISRATVYRQTTALAEDGLLEQTPTGYRTTGAGSAIVDAAERFDRSVRAIDRLEPLLESVTDPEFSRHIEHFADADLAAATPQNPNEPIELWLEHFESFDRFRGLIVAGCPPAVTEQGVEHARAGDDFEVICSPLALEADRNAASEALETIATAETPSLYTHTEVPFTMGIADRTVLVIGFDDETTLPVACVATDDAGAREWASSLYRRHRREAEPLDVSATPSTE